MKFQKHSLVASCDSQTKRKTKKRKRKIRNTICIHSLIANNQRNNHRTAVIQFNELTQTKTTQTTFINFLAVFHETWTYHAMQRLQHSDSASYPSHVTFMFLLSHDGLHQSSSQHLICLQLTFQYVLHSIELP